MSTVISVEMTKSEVITKIKKVITWLFPPSLIASYEYIKQWDFDELDIFDKEFDPSIPKNVIVNMVNDDELRCYLTNTPNFMTTRGVYESLYLVQLMLEQDPEDDSGYRCLAARVRFAVSIRDLVILALENYK